MNFLPGLALNHNPPNLHLLSSWDYRHEALQVALIIIKVYAHTYTYLV
jgi:hypothetical protein